MIDENNKSTIASSKSTVDNNSLNHKETTPNKSEAHSAELPIGISLGLCMGVALGAVFKSIGVGTALGICVGAFIGRLIKTRNN